MTPEEVEDREIAEDRAILDHPPTQTNDVGGGGTSTNDKGMTYGGTSGDAYTASSDGTVSGASLWVRITVGLIVLVVVLAVIFAVM